MSKVFEDKACTQLLLQIILDRKDLKVREVHTQYNLKNLQGRSVRLDILAIDHDGHVYNIEIQRDNSGAIPERARYNSSLLDANSTVPNENLENLATSYVIFITEKDILKKGLPIYYFDRYERNTFYPLNDRAHIIYVNSQIQDETALGKLMHDFYCTNSDDLYYKILADRARYFKEEKKGVSIMSDVMQEWRDEERTDERIITKLVDIKKLMKNLKLSLGEAMSVLEISDEERRILSTRI